MKSIRKTFLLAVVVALLSLTPSAIAQTNHFSTDLPSIGTLSFHLATFMPPPDRGCRHDDHHCHVAASEGGSAALYLLMAGATCLAAIAFGVRKQGARKSA